MQPGIKTIIAGGVMLLLGVLVVPLLVVLQLILGNQHGAQFEAPGSMELAVKEPGRYYLWNDFRTVFNGRTYDRSENLPDGVEIQIRDASGRQLEFISDSSISWSTGTSSKKSIGYVAVEQPGQVTVQVSGRSDDRILSFSTSGLLGVFGLIVGGVGLSMVVAIAGLGLIIWGTVKLVRANRRGEPGSAPKGVPDALTAARDP
jgi:hypothetical protein